MLDSIDFSTSIGSTSVALIQVFIRFQHFPFVPKFTSCFTDFNRIVSSDSCYCNRCTFDGCMGKTTSSYRTFHQLCKFPATLQQLVITSKNVLQVSLSGMCLGCFLVALSFVLQVRLWLLVVESYAVACIKSLENLIVSFCRVLIWQQKWHQFSCSSVYW